MNSWVFQKKKRITNNFITSDPQILELEYGISVTDNLVCILQVHASQTGPCGPLLVQRQLPILLFQPRDARGRHAFLTAPARLLSLLMWSLNKVCRSYVVYLMCGDSVYWRIVRSQSIVCSYFGCADCHVLQVAFNKTRILIMGNEQMKIMIQHEMTLHWYLTQISKTCKIWMTKSKSGLVKLFFF